MVVTELYPPPPHDKAIYLATFTPNPKLANLTASFGNVMIHENMAFAYFGVILSAPTDWVSNELLLGSVDERARPDSDWNGTRRLMIIRGNNGTEVSLRNVRIEPNGDVYMTSSVDVQDTLIAFLPGVPYYLV